MLKNILNKENKLLHYTHLTEDNRHFGKKLLASLIYKGGALIKKQFIETIMGNVSDWRFYTSGALLGGRFTSFDCNCPKI